MDDAKRIRTEQIIQLAREFYIRADRRDITTFKDREAACCIEIAEYFFEAVEEYRKQPTTKEGETSLQAKEE